MNQGTLDWKISRIPTRIIHDTSMQCATQKQKPNNSNIPLRGERLGLGPAPVVAGALGDARVGRSAARDPQHVEHGLQRGGVRRGEQRRIQSGR